jgi:membrane associated rhomboid family serine protease
MMSSLLEKARIATDGLLSPKRSPQRQQQRRRRNDDEDEAGTGSSDAEQTMTETPYNLQIEDGGEEGKSTRKNDVSLSLAKSFVSHPEEAHYRQRCAPCSTFFCLSQTVVLALMMWQCGVAPFRINPMIGPGPDALNYWGAKNAVLIIDEGETYRLFTPVFLHAGLIHLAGNVFVQMDAGNMWEMEWGSLVWMIVYVGSAFGSSVFSCCFMPDSISVGSSGAVMGLFGAKLSEIALLCCENSTTLKERAAALSRKRQACQVFGGIVLVMAMSFIPFVDWAAHLGGVIAGFVIGLVCFSFRFRHWFFVLIWFVAGVGSVVALYSTMMVYMYTKVETNDDLR